MANDQTPVLVGGGQFTNRATQTRNLDALQSPIGLMAEASRRALADTGAGDRVRGAIDTVAVVRFTVDTNRIGGNAQWSYRNPPLSLAKAMGVAPARAQYTGVGGNSPQWLVNRTAEAIARGEVKVALLSGAEALASLALYREIGRDTGWKDDPGRDPEEIGINKRGASPREVQHGIHYPVTAYPLFENALRHKRGKSFRDHQLAMGRLFAPFTAIAAQNPHAWFQKARSAEEIATPGPKNRYVGFPYTKYMNAIMAVDQAAALVMTSVGEARRLGIPEANWVYLHGCADANDKWLVSERVNFHSSPAIRGVCTRSLAMAGLNLADIDYFDFYSCFPVAVEVALQELGLSEDDPRGFTVTGGLPYFGGAGNNYTMHSIATMLERVRAKPGSRGLLTGNGWYLTKESCGIYSTRPTDGAWTREDPAVLQAEIDALPAPSVDDQPAGFGTIETYTVAHGRDGPDFGLVVGRLENGRRFHAHMKAPADMARLMEQDCIGLRGQVVASEPVNSFAFA